MLCTGQMRVGFSGPYALDWNVVRSVANDMGVTTDERFWVVIKSCEDIIIGSMRPGTTPPGIKGKANG